MAEQVVKLVDDASNTGKKVRVAENTVSGNTVQQQVVSLADSAGNLLEGTDGSLPIKQGQTSATTGSLTTTSSVSRAVTGYGSVVIGISGTYTGAFVAEGSDDGGSNYNYTLPMARLDGGATELATGSLTDTTRGWRVPTAGLTNVRFRATTLASGSASIRITPTAAAAVGVQHVGGQVASGATDAGNPVKVGGVYNSSLPTLTNGQRGDVQLDASGRQLTASIGLGATSNGLTHGKARDLANTPTAIKASAGVLYGLQIENTQGAAAYIQIFNVATGSVTLGTTTPDLEILVAATSQKEVILPNLGVPFTTAISIASTTGSKGSTGSSNGVHVHWQYA